MIKYILLILSYTFDIICPLVISLVKDNRLNNFFFLLLFIMRKVWYNECFVNLPVLCCDKITNLVV